MQFDLRKKDFIAYTIISIVGTILVILGLSERISSEPAKPTQALIGPVGAIPTFAPDTFSCTGPQSLSYRTLGDIIAQLGSPEKLHVWHEIGVAYGGMSYGYRYLYPRKGVNFYVYPPERYYGNSDSIDAHLAPATAMPMDNLQARVFSECYPPTTLEAYMARYPARGEGGSSGGNQYTNWISP